MSGLYLATVEIDTRNLHPDLKAIIDVPSSFFTSKEDEILSTNLRQERFLSITHDLVCILGSYEFKANKDFMKRVNHNPDFNIDEVNKRFLYLKANILEKFGDHLRQYLTGKEELKIGSNFTINIQNASNSYLKHILPDIRIKFDITQVHELHSKYLSKRYPFPLIPRSIDFLYLIHSVFVTEEDDLLTQPSLRVIDRISRKLHLDSDHDAFVDDKELASILEYIEKRSAYNENAIQQCKSAAHLTYQASRALIYAYLIDHCTDDFSSYIDSEDLNKLMYNKKIEVNNVSKNISFTFNTPIFEKRPDVSIQQESDTSKKYSNTFVKYTMSTCILTVATIGEVLLDTLSQIAALDHQEHISLFDSSSEKKTSSTDLKACIDDVSACIQKLIVSFGDLNTILTSMYKGDHHEDQSRRRTASEK